MTLKRQLVFDTTIWIDFFRNIDSPAVDLLTAYIEHDDPVVLTPTILQEVLQGIRDDAQFNKVKDILTFFQLLELPHSLAAIGAADLYRTLRKKGATIRKSNDCLIAFYCINFDIPLVHGDGDFDLIAKYARLKLWTNN